MTQEEKINVAELLKDCPKGMELDCTICNNVVTLEGVDTVGYYPIRITSKDGFNHVLTHEGCIYKREDAKCVIFPKGKTTWEGFVPPIQPKFKVGDRIKYRSGEIVYRIVKITEDSYVLDNLCSIPISIEHMYNLVPNKFDTTNLKPFDKVLCRDKDNEVWSANIYSHYDSKSDRPFVCTGWNELNSYITCVPYEKNEHLLGTTDDCDDFYKNW